MKSEPPRPYHSPARRAAAAATRERILAALSQVVGESGEGRAIFDLVARKAGVERRTVFRHFPNREALLAALWEWINKRITPQPLPARAEDLITLPGIAFEGFDRYEGIIRASLRSPSGREMRLAALPQRQAAFRTAVADALPAASPRDRRRFEAVAHLLYSAAAWETLKDYCDLDGREAGQTVMWAMNTLLGAMRPPRTPRSRRTGTEP